MHRRFFHSRTARPHVVGLLRFLTKPFSKIAVALLATCAAHAQSPVEFSDDERAKILRHSPLLAPPANSTNRFADDPAAARLGQRFFFERRFSANESISCATCHDPAKGLADGKPLGAGLGPLPRHTPTLWNVAYQRWFFWDGRADSLWSQVVQPIENPIEMGGTRVRVARRIAEDASLRSAYEALFGSLPDFSDRVRFPDDAAPDAARPDSPRRAKWLAMSESDRDAATRVIVNVGKAIEAYERKLTAPESPFDRFVRGLREDRADLRNAISESAQRGLKLFIGRANCRSCHVGPAFTDHEFHSIFVPPRSGGEPTDPGRHDGTRLLLADPLNALGPYSDDREGAAAQRLRYLVNRPENWGLFKTPSLRNVARTAPYMHQGQFESLERVIEFYSTLEGAISVGHHAREMVLQPLRLTDEEKRDLVAFLESLTSDAPAGDWLTPPTDSTNSR